MNDGALDRGTAYRDDVQGLRAIAVLDRDRRHAGVRSSPGGFVGVDVFFVISGFLISQLLFREVERTGRLSIRGFYARRARRILPAATLVTIATLVASLIWLSVVDPLEVVTRRGLGRRSSPPTSGSPRSAPTTSPRRRRPPRCSTTGRCGGGAVLPRLAADLLGLRGAAARRRGAAALGREAGAAALAVLLIGAASLRVVGLTHRRRPLCGVLLHARPGLGARRRRAHRAGRHTGSPAAASAGRSAARWPASAWSRSRSPAGDYDAGTAVPRLGRPPLPGGGLGAGAARRRRRSSTTSRC